MNYRQQLTLLYQRLKGYANNVLNFAPSSSARQLAQLNAQLQQEISDRHQVEAALRASQLRYQAIVEDQTELICRFDSGGILTFMNQAYYRYFQHHDVDLLGQNFLGVLAQRSLSNSVKQFAALTPENLTEFWECQLKNPDGQARWFQWTVRAILNAVNQVCEYQAVGRDITRQKEVEFSLQSHAQRYQQMLETAADGIWLVDLDNRTTFINQKMATMLGYHVDEVMGRSLFDFMDEEGLAIAAQKFENRRVDIPQQYELKLCCKDGSSLWVIISTTPNLDASNRHVGLFGMMTDITERKKAEAILRDSEERFRAIFEQAGVGMAILTPEGRFFRVNQKLCELLGYNRLEMLTQTHTQLLHPDYLAQTLAGDQHLINETQVYYTYPQQYRRADQTWIWLNVTISLIREASGQPKYFIGVMADISTQQAALQEREAAEESQRALLNAIPEVACLLDVEGKILQGNQALADLLQLPLAQLVGQTLKQVFPTDDHAQYLQQACQTQQPLKFTEYRDDRYFEHTIYPIVDSHQQVQRLAFFALDLTDRKAAEQTIQSANQQLTEKLDEIEHRHQEMVQLGRMNGFLQVCTSLQEAYCAIADLLKPLFPHCSGMVFRINPAEQWAECIAQWGDSTASQSQFPVNHCWGLRRGQLYEGTSEAVGLLCQHIQRPAHPLESLCLPLMAQGDTIGLLHLESQGTAVLTLPKQQLAHTVSEHLALALANLELRDTLKHQSIRDPLTGLYNRRYMAEALKQALSRAQREHEPLGIIMLDVDHFKKFNDTFGHEAGDMVLRELGHFLYENVRGSDVPCRYGGEEMLLILPGISLKTTELRAETLRQGVKELRISSQNQLLQPITISAGVASFPDHGDTLESLLQAADMALYEAKRQGRDRTMTCPLASAQA